MSQGIALKPTISTGAQARGFAGLWFLSLSSFGTSIGWACFTFSMCALLGFQSRISKLPRDSIQVIVFVIFGALSSNLKG
jgi:hypothetical protein